MQTKSTMRLVLMMAAMAVGSPAFAGVCVKVGVGDSGAEVPYTLVLRNVGLKPGASGAIAGYAVREDGVFTPLSGGYAVGPVSAAISATRSAAFFTTNGSGGLLDETTFYSISIPLRGGEPTYCLWRRNHDGSTTTDCTVAALVDCKSAPHLPKKLPVEIER